MIARSRICYTIVLLCSVLLHFQSENCVGFQSGELNQSNQPVLELKFKLDAGKHSRTRSVIKIPLKQLAAKSKETLGSFEPKSFTHFLVNLESQKQIPHHISNNQTLIFVLDEELGKGKSRNFKLSLSKAATRQVRPPAKNTIQFTDDGKSILAKINGKPILSYAHAYREPPNGLGKVYRKSGYIHPLYDSKGRQVTGDFAPDHAHQHGLFFAWVNTTFGGQKVDFWNQHRKTGKVEHGGKLSFKSGHVGTLTTHQDHLDITDPKNPKKIIDEQWQLEIYPFTKSYMFDLTVKQNVVTDLPLKINKYHYGGLGIRGNQQWLISKDSKRHNVDANFITSQNRDRTDGNHSRPNWTSIYGKIDGKFSTVTIFDHRDNYQSPQPVRLHPEMPYFCLAPMVAKSFLIKKGTPFGCQYRIQVSNGKPDKAVNDRTWIDFNYPIQVSLVGGQ